MIMSSIFLRFAVNLFFIIKVEFDKSFEVCLQEKRPQVLGFDIGCILHDKHVIWVLSLSGQSCQVWNNTWKTIQGFIQSSTLA